MARAGAPPPPAGGASPPSPRVPASRHARLDRAVFGLLIVSTIVTLPGIVDNGAIMSEAWAYVLANCMLVVVCTRWPGSWRGWRRDGVVAAHRVASALFGQRAVAAGRRLPLRVNSWVAFFGVSEDKKGQGGVCACFFFCSRVDDTPSSHPFPLPPTTNTHQGRTLVIMVAVQSACLRLAHAPRLAAATLAATAAVLLTHQAPACRSLVHGFLGSQPYFERVCAFARAAADTVVAAVVGGQMRGAARALCPAHACSAAMSLLFAAALATGTAIDFWAAGAVDGGVAAAAVGGALVMVWGVLDAFWSAANLPSGGCQPLPPPPVAVVKAGALVLPRMDRIRLWPALLWEGFRRAVAPG